MTALRLAAVAALAALGAAQEAVRIEVWPNELRFDAPGREARVVVVALGAGGVHRDVTADVAVSGGDGLVELAGGSVRALAPGAAQIELAHGGARATLGVTVADAPPPPVSFRNDVVPVLTRSGCNSGACHGSAAGKNGFRLTLFGYDPASDHRALTRDAFGRRLAVDTPAASLLLRKPIGEVRHKGGLKLAAGEPGYAVIRDWIEAGARDDGDGAPALTGLAVVPPSLVLPEGGSRVGFAVQASYADGSTRDVTDLALLSVSSETVVRIEEHELVTGERGEGFVLARFGSHAQVCELIVVPAADDFVWPDVAPINFVDERIDDKLRRLRVAPAPRCDDATFVRRVYFDLLGRAPAAAEVEGFLADPGPDKRNALVARLVDRPEFADVQAMHWAEVLRIEGPQLRTKGIATWSRWLREQLRAGATIDRIVHAMLTANGSNHRVPAAGFYASQADPKVVAEMVAQDFLGVRMQCAQCHDHPFERWTMADYYGFTAFFAQVGRKRGEDPRELIVYDRRSGGVNDPNTGRAPEPRFLGGGEPEIARGTDRRAVVADWLTSPDNERFAANIANRIWAQLFGRGIVEPVDDVRVSNPPSHPRLLADLARKLVEYGYDVRPLVRDLCASRAYQAEPGPAPDATFAGAIVRRLGAEQLLDAVAQVTGVANELRGVPAGGSAVLVDGEDPGSRFLDLFGRPRRATACTCERRSEPTLNQVLHLLNGATIETKIRAKEGWLRRRLAVDVAADEMVRELWLAAYARPPRAGELVAVVAAVAGAEDHAAAWEDVLWAVLNSREFLFRH